MRNALSVVLYSTKTCTHDYKHSLLLSLECIVRLVPPFLLGTFLLIVLALTFAYSK